ncbi:MAG: Cation efflux system protein CusC [Nitrospira sp.]|nr:Cation efflux system protein CusC [Nitrospira sp.]
MKLGNTRFLATAALTLVTLGTLGPHAGLAQPAQKTPPALLQGSFLALQQAIDTGLKNHPLVQEGDANLKMNEARTEQARSLYYPQVSANMDAAGGAARINPRFVTPAGGLLQPNMSSYATGILASQRLYDFGYTQNMVQASELSQRASAQDVTARRALIVINIQRTYLNSLKRRRLVQIAEETVRERGLITGQIETLYRQQLKSKLDFDLARVELVNAQSFLVKSRNDLKSSFADINRAMGVVGATDYVLEDVVVEVRTPRELPALIADSLTHPELQRAKEQSASAEAKLRAMKKQYLPTVSAIASGGQYDTFDSSRNVPNGGWWAGGASVSMPIFTGFMIENQVREASAQQVAAESISLSIEQALTQQVTNAYLDTLTFAQQILLAKEQVKTSLEALHLAKQRYKLGLGTVVEVTQSEVAVTGAQTRLAEAHYDYKIAEVTLAYASGNQSKGEIDSALQ